MEEKPILLILQDDSHIETVESRSLRKESTVIVEKIEQHSFDISNLPETLQELLLNILKPLFSRQTHPKLTSAGRKKLVEPSIPANLTRFNDENPFDQANRPLWKNGWTSALLQWMLRCYGRLTDLGLRRKTLEAHFHYLVPPILQQIDDIETDYKASGCQALKLLCEQLHAAQSTILKKTGLTDIFIDALKTDFAMLPTLTPEDESLTLYKAMYPAYRSLINARFGVEGSNVSESPTVSSSQAKKQPRGPEVDQRVSYLTLLYRHQLLHSLNHISVSGAGSTIAPELSTFLLSQVGWLVEDMGLAFVVHLQDTLPMLRRLMCDPFATGHEGMLFECVVAVKRIVAVCWPRIREKWWGECLRGAVGCWGIVSDDEETVGDEKRRANLQKVKQELKALVCLLEDVVGDDFREARRELVTEDGSLVQLLDGV